MYDACVLYPSPVRDLLIRLAIEELVVARWSDAILDEVFRNLAADRPDLDRSRLAVTRARMNAAVLDVVVPSNAETLERVTGLPDPDDRHVVATAIDAGASVVVTFNVRDFPAAVLEPIGVSALHPDDFVGDLFTEHPDALTHVIRSQAADLRNPPRTVGDVLDALERCGLPRLATAVRGHLRR